MVNDKCPIDMGNAMVINRKLATKTSFAMLRLEDIFDFFSDEPILIIAQKEKDGREEEYECIIKIRIWNHQKKCYSWGIYSAEREQPTDLIIRRVIWNLDQDENELKKKCQEKTE